jgi:hypothetical protein
MPAYIRYAHSTPALSAALLCWCCVSCRQRGLGRKLLLHIQRALHLPGTMQARIRARRVHSLLGLHQPTRFFFGLLVSCEGQVPGSAGVLHQHPTLQRAT